KKAYNVAMVSQKGEFTQFFGGRRETSGDRVRRKPIIPITKRPDSIGGVGIPGGHGIFPGDAPVKRPRKKSAFKRDH
ncbi:MAG TPA: hypothetical protein VN711_02115, partial [Candidatus Saccharimonadales bacterium]|nr:hypothetical protein [Candidatus Saccharimonadales bacterium]